ncbi:MAG: RDD family protein [Dehalococcoidia bacterium]
MAFAFRRLAALLLDWIVGALAGLILLVFATTILLIASDLNRHELPAGPVFVAVIVISTWVPVWFLYRAIAVSCSGATLGLAALELAVVDSTGRPPGPWRSAFRVFLLDLFSLPLLLSPFLVIGAKSFDSFGPPYASIPLLSIVSLSTIACASALIRNGADTWHDRLTGTRVVRSEEKAAGSPA